MHKRKLWPALALGGAVLLSLLAHSASAQQDILMHSKQELLKDIGRVVASSHYSPQPIDDDFSKKLWSRFLTDLDPQGQLFVQSDLDKLRAFELSLDDEIKGQTPLGFLPAVLKIYRQRVYEASKDYQVLLSKPVLLKGSARVYPDGRTEKRFALNAAELQKFRANRATYLVFQKLVAMKSDSGANVGYAKLEPLARKRLAIRQERVFDRLLQQADLEQQFVNYVNAVLGQMDPHSSYLPPSEQQRFLNTMSNRFAGIGARLGDHDEGAMILALEPNGASARSGLLEVGDVLLRLGEGINGELKDLEGFTTQEIMGMVRGEKDTELKLVVRKAAGLIKTISITRATLSQESAFVKTAVVLQGAKKIGYITFPLFYQGGDPISGPFSSVDVAQAIERLKGQQVEGIVFDLRYNGGGSLQEVVKMVSLLIGVQPVVQVRERNGEPIPKTANDLTQQLSMYTPVGQIYNGPISVLVNEYSASASEIFAAAIQDSRRGVILGSSSTFGKGTVQRITPLSKKSDGVLQLTVQQFYRLNGASTQLNGIVPDIILPDVYEYDEIREKHLPCVLPWDMVAPLNTLNVEGSYDDLSTVDQIRGQVSQNTAFSKIEKNALLRRDQASQIIRLDIDDYQKVFEKSKAIAKENQKAISLDNEKQLRLQALNPNGENKWIELLRTDIYLEQAVKVLLEGKSKSQ